MKKKALILIAAGFVAFISLAGCTGEEIPEAWNWTYTDSLDIMELLAEQEDFLTSSQVFTDAEIDVSIGQVVADSVYPDTSFDRYYVSSFSFDISDEFFGYEFDAAIDTTVTGYVVDTVTGEVSCNIDSMILRGDSVPVVLDSVMTKTLRYASWGAVFFDSTDNDAQWNLARYSGGIEGTSPDVASSPVIDSVMISAGQTSLTVTALADTTGYGIRGLFTPLRFIGISAGESVFIDDVSVSQPDNQILYAAGNQGWMPFEQGMEITFSQEGYYRFYIIAVNPLSYISSTRDWEMIIWGIPVIVE